MNRARFSDRTGYTLAAFTGAAAIALFLWLIMHGILSNRENFVRCDAPGETTLTLSKPGDYTIFYEYEREDSSQAVWTPVGIENLHCALSSPSGERIEVHRAPNFHSYALNRTRGQSLFDFTVPAAGEYHFAAEYPTGMPVIPAHLMIRPYHRIQAVALLAQCMGVLVVAGVAIVLIVRGMRGGTLDVLSAEQEGLASAAPAKQQV